VADETHPRSVLVSEPGARPNELATGLPRDCTFSAQDWAILSRYWYPVAFSHELKAQPLEVRLLDERVVIYRIASGQVLAARDLCFHRGAPMSMGHVEGDEIVCRYHGLRYAPDGRCTLIPSSPKAAISPRLRLVRFSAREQYGLIWVCLVDDPAVSFPAFPWWDDPEYLQVLPDSTIINAAAGRQLEGFLDVSHFSFVHADSFGEPENPVVPEYPVTPTPYGLSVDYVSTVSNYATGSKHLNPPGYLWRRTFEVYLPFTASLTVTFPGDGQLHILNAASPISARKTRLFVPICRNFDKDAPLQDTLDFNYQVFAEDIAVVERQWPEDLPLDLHAEGHFPADRTSIAYRRALAQLGLGRSFTA
jgi:phenylpropionate dioxygenase-like ring-hydroxylating dioxygenase large terminal subunit